MRFFLIWVLLLNLVFLNLSSAQESPFLIRNEIDLPLTAGALSISAMPTLFASEQPMIVQQNYDRKNVFFLDRSVTYFHSPVFNHLGNYLTFAIPPVALVAGLPWTSKSNWSIAYENSLMIIQTMALTSMINQLVRHSFTRPRPYMYSGDSNKVRQHRDDHTSFFSGHAAMAFGAGIAFWRIHSARYPDSAANPWIQGIAIASGSVVGISRALGGRHFWTDVLAGSVVGVSMGYLVPELHKKAPTKPGSISLQAVGPNYVALGTHF